MNNCPCCSEPLLKHIRHNNVYWFCPHCHQEMPNFSVPHAAQLLVGQHWQSDSDELFSRIATVAQ